MRRKRRRNKKVILYVDVYTFLKEKKETLIMLICDTFEVDRTDVYLL